MKKFRILSLALILLLATSLFPVSALAVTDPSIGAQAAILVDADSGEVYYQKNADQVIQPSSTVKMVTALLVVEAIERGEIALSDTVTASGNISYNLTEDSTDASPRITYGEAMSVEDLLYCVMLASANEACNMLAEYVSGSVTAFVDAMNARASELGCTNTHFSNCNGMEDGDLYSTARDFSLLAREAVSHRMFQTICGTLNHTVPATNVSDARSLVNTNALLNSESEYYYSYAYGVKTGYQAGAGYSLVAAEQRDNMNVISVVFGSQNVGEQFTDTITIFNWLSDNFESRQILSPTEVIMNAPVELGAASTVGIRAENGVTVVLPRDFDLTRIGYDYVLYYEQNGESLEAPVNAGQVLGELTVVELDENRAAVQTYGTSRLVAASTVEMSRQDYLQTQILDLLHEPMVHRVLVILAVLLGIYLLLVLIYCFQRMRHLRSLRKAKKARARRQTEVDAQWLVIPDEEDEEPAIEYFTEPEPAAPQLEEIVREEIPEEPREAPAAKPTATAKKTEPAPAPTPIRRKNPEELHKEVFDDDFFDSFFKN